MPGRSALDLTITLPGLSAFTVALSRLRTAISDWRPFWTDTFAPFFYSWVQRDFVLEGGQSGTSWAPLSASYAAWKAAHTPGAGILVRSGALKASLAGPNAPLTVLRASSDALEIGTSVAYASFHQLGTRRLPQRPPLRVNAAFMTVVGQSLQKYVQAKWAEERAAVSATAA